MNASGEWDISSAQLSLCRVCMTRQSDSSIVFRWKKPVKFARALLNNYSPKAKWILSNNLRDEVEGIIRQYSLSLNWTTANNGLRHKTKMQLFVCIQVCSRRVLIISLHVHRLWISLLIEFSSKTGKRNITKKNPVPLFHLCWLHPQLSSLSQNE